MFQLRETDVETVFADLSFVVALDTTDKQQSEHLSRKLEKLTK